MPNIMQKRRKSQYGAEPGVCGSGGAIEVVDLRKRCNSGAWATKNRVQSTRCGLHCAETVDVTIVSCARERKFRKAKLLDFAQTLKMPGVDHRKLRRLNQN